MAAISSAFVAVVSAVALYVLSLKMPRVGAIGRCLAYYGCLVACASYGVAASVVLRLIGKSGYSQWTVACSYKWTMWFATGVWFDIIEGEEHLSLRPSVLVGNHQTELDILLLGTVFRPFCSVTAKKSLKHMPFLGWFMALSGTVFIDRGNREKALLAMDGAVRTIQENQQSVWMFPEGTRSYSSEPALLPFKKGAFHLAIKAGAPIVPVVAENYAHVANVKDRRFNSGYIRVKGVMLTLQHGFMGFPSCLADDQ